MTRREFQVCLVGLVASPVVVSGEPSRVVILEAIAGARLPETLAITIHSPKELRRGVWELRTYRGAEAELAGDFTKIFRRAGIRPLLSQTAGPDLSYFIPFENLTARDQAWNAVNADPQWMEARARFRSYHFGLYRVS